MKQAHIKAPEAANDHEITEYPDMGNPWVLLVCAVVLVATIAASVVLPWGWA